MSKRLQELAGISEAKDQWYEEFKQTCVQLFEKFIDERIEYAKTGDGYVAALKQQRKRPKPVAKQYMNIVTKG
jgi:hypothetical protein